MERGISDSTADEAGYWDARLRSPDCSPVDRARFAEWRNADPGHRDAFERLQILVATLHHHKGRADVRALRDAALRARKPGLSHGRKLAAAAAVVAVAVATTLWTTLPDPVRQASLTALAAGLQRLSDPPQETIYETGTGQRSVSTLSDGSCVELDARSRIKVSFTHNMRNIELVYGQALFHVAHNPRRPFIVRAADRDIIAVGTQFDVRLDATSMHVTLIEGKVEVSRDSGALASGGVGAASLTSTQGELYSPIAVLTPGQQFVARLSGGRGKKSVLAPGQATVSVDSPEIGAAAGDTQVRTVDITKATGWREGRLFFEDQPLAEAVAEMNRHSPVQLVVGDPHLAELRINGMFRADEQDAFLAALEQYFPIVVQQRGATEIVLTLRR